MNSRHYSFLNKIIIVTTVKDTTDKKKTTHDLTLDKELQVSNSYWKGESVSSLTGFPVQSDYPRTYATKSKATWTERLSMQACTHILYSYLVIAIRQGLINWWVNKIRTLGGWMWVASNVDTMLMNKVIKNKITVKINVQRIRKRFRGILCIIPLV